MATRLPGILDHLSSLLRGKVPSPPLDRAIPSGRFVHAKMPVEYELPRTSKAPFPFHISALAQYRADPTEENVAGDEVYRGLTFLVRVGYALKAIEEYVQQKAILTDAHAIHRCLSDPDSWDIAAGFARFSCSGARIVEAAVPGAQIDQPELMLILEIPCELVYREDYS